METPLPSGSASLPQEDLLRALFDATTDYVFMKDLDGYYVTINRAAAQVLGMTPAEVIGKNDYALLPAELADRLAAQDRQVIGAGVPLTFEEPMQFPDRLAYLQTVKSPWRDASGAIIGVMGIGRDVTARKHVEDALQEIESRFQKLFASDLLGIHIPDRFGAITEANDEFLRITGYTREDLDAGRVRWDVMTPAEYSAADRQHIAEAARRGTCTPYEKEYVRKDGTRVPIMCGYTLLEGSQDDYIAFIQDLTAVKNSEKAMLQAEKLNTASRLTASMAHEINNPLAAVINLVYLASGDEMLQPHTRMLLQHADRELARVSRVVTQTLRFHKQSTAPTVTDVSEIVDSVFPMFSSKLSGDGVLLQRQYAPVRALRCFHHELRHAFANVVSNAIDAMAATGGRLRVRVRQGHRWGSQPEAGIFVTVADTGSGIPKIMQKRLYEPFLSTKEQTGTGLGLWATKNIVSKHRGRISVRTARGTDRHGTVFTLFFPFDGVPDDAHSDAQ